MPGIVSTSTGKQLFLFYSFDDENELPFVVVSACPCRQRVYGVTTATVKVGYEYTTCPDVLWQVQTTKLSGHDMSISDIGGWNLDIHHRYNFHEGKK